MDNPENSLIIASTRQLPTFELNTFAKEAKTRALEKSALIARVTDHDSKVLAVRAQEELKRQINAIEKARKELKEPILDAGRKLDKLCASESLELEKEFGRVSNVVKEFDDAERRRVAEEERLQREELARIEREKQAELKRIADEQAAQEAEARRIQEEADRKVREAQEAAAKLAAEAKNKEQREAAERARLKAESEAKAADAERERQAAQMRELAAASAAKSAAIEEQAAAAAYVESRPIEMTRVAGQVTKTDWEITVTNPYELAKYHPDCVKIEPLLTPIKAALNEGRTVKGIRAEKVIKAGVRVGKDQNLIEV